MSLRLFLALVAFAAPLAAVADPSYIDVEKRLTAEQRHATGIDTLTPDQLELLNRLLRDGTPKTSPSSAASSPPIAGEAEPTPRRGGYIGLDDQAIESRVKGTVTAWEPGTEFELENGQKWKVLKGSGHLREAKTSLEIHIIPGVAGRWFMELDENLPKARVYRID